MPTARGRDLRAVVIALLTWNNRHFAPEGPSVVLVNNKTGVTVDPILADPVTGPRTRQRYAAIDGISSVRKPAAARRKRHQ